MRLRSVALAIATLCFAMQARAEIDDFLLGNGDGGALTVAAAASPAILNVYAGLTASVAVGATSVTVGSAIPAGGSFVAGSLVMLYQATGLSPAPVSGNAGPFDLTANPVGHYEFARVQSAAASGGNTVLTLTAPLISTFVAADSQAIFVPEYTQLTLNANVRVTGSAWDGQRGGVVAFLSQGTVTLSAGSSITASQLGFRGGLLVNTIGSAADNGCTELDRGVLFADIAAWAQKGEGISGLYGPSDVGRGNLANGAGGGDCDNSGGGGGGNATPGGQGGNTWVGDSGDGGTGRPVGGLPGAQLLYSAVDNLVFGGGGGAGQENNNVGTAGGIGGGVIFFRADALAGAGTISADGQSVGSGTNDGQGGGGAGGTISIRLVSSAMCGSLEAVGGHGGTVVFTQDHGPGGGGGAGTVLIQTSDDSTCPVSDPGGANGIVLEGAVDAGPAGATPATAPTSGPTVEPTGFQRTAPSISAPTGGETVSETPTITGTGSPNATVLIYLDGVLVGSTIADGSGSFTFTPTTPFATGAHTVTAQQGIEAVYGPVSSAVGFVSQPPAPAISSPASGDSTGPSPSIVGTAPADATVTLTLDGTQVVGAADGSGHFSIPVGPLAPGPHSVSASDTVGGVTSQSSATTDFSVLPVPTISSPSVGEVVESLPTISGTASPSATVNLSIDGSPAGTAVADGNGNFSFTPSSPLAPGGYTVSATQTLGAATSGSSATVSFFVEPGAPTVTAPNPGQDVSTTPTISGTASPGATVAIFIDGDPTPVATVVADGSGNFSVQLITPLSTGPHNVTAQQTVNTIPGPTSAPVSFTVLSEAPPVISQPTSGEITDLTPTIVGTAPANSSVTISVDGSVVGTVVADGSGNFNLPLSTPLTVGNHSVSATDVVSGVSSGTSTPVDFVASVVPAPAIVAPAPGDQTGPLPTVTGTAPAGSTVTIFVDGVAVGTAVADGGGTYLVTLTSPLPPGSHVVTAQDSSGSVLSPISLPVSFTSAPAPPTIGAPTSGQTVPQNTSVSGTAPAGATVTVYADGVQIGTTTAASDGTYSVSVGPLAVGSETLTATDTLSGETSVASVAVTVTVSGVGTTAGTSSATSGGTTLGTAASTGVNGTGTASTGTSGTTQGTGTAGTASGTTNGSTSTSGTTSGSTSTTGATSGPTATGSSTSVTTSNAGATGATGSTGGGTASGSVGGTNGTAGSTSSGVTTGSVSTGVTTTGSGIATTGSASSAVGAGATSTGGTLSGTSGGVPTLGGGGCGCNTGADPGSLLLFGLSLLAFGQRRRDHRELR